MSERSGIKDIERVNAPDLWTEILQRDPASFRSVVRSHRRVRVATALAIVLAVAGVVVPLRLLGSGGVERTVGTPPGHHTITIIEPSGSMEPTIQVSQEVVLDLDAYGKEPPGREDVVAFGTDKHPGFTFIKRVIGLPGDTVEQRLGGDVFVNGEKLDEPYVGDVDPTALGPWTVEPDHVFVMGDNRANSNDSRYGLGQVPIADIEGKVLLDVEPTGVASPPPPAAVAPGGPRLFLAGDGELWIVDVNADSVRHLDLPELSPGDPPYRIERRGDKLVLWGSTAIYVFDPATEGPPQVLVNDSLVFLSSATPDRVWVAIGQPEKLTAIREVTIDGKITVSDTEPPGGRWPVAAVEEGVVFPGSDDESLEVWDWRTGQVIRRLPGRFPLAWEGHLLAWCNAQCDEAHITDFSSGVDQVISLPAGIFSFQGYLGAFSPDGSRLALVGLTHKKFEQADAELVLVDVESVDAEAVPGTLGRVGYNFVDWSASGESVFITGGQRFAHRQLVEYKPAEGTVRTLPVEVGDFYGLAAA
jgi:signal peptidase I